MWFFFREETYADNAQGLNRNISGAAEIMVHKRKKIAIYRDMG